MEKKIQYVAGFFFDEKLDNVWLIRKQKPDWQKDLLNGVGGKIEENEGPISAMVREFREEAGIYVYDWHKFCVIGDEDWEVTFFYSIAKNDFDFGRVKTMTDEIMIHIEAADVIYRKTISNLRWLIPMAIEHATKNLNYHVNYSPVNHSPHQQERGLNRKL